MSKGPLIVVAVAFVVAVVSLALEVTTVAIGGLVVMFVSAFMVRWYLWERH
jgi:hypothetical protein